MADDKKNMKNYPVGKVLKWLSILFTGVDIVLNSLAEEKLQSSLRLLAQHGCFLEIGKFDLSNNTGLGTYMISRYKHIGLQGTKIPLVP